MPTLRALRLRLELGRAHVRPAAQEIGRNADRDARGAARGCRANGRAGRRSIPAAGRGGRRARSPSAATAPLAGGSPTPSGRARSGPGKRRARRSRRPCSGRGRFPAPPCCLTTFSRAMAICACKVRICDVIAGDVADQGDEHVVVGGDRGEIGGVGLFDAVAELAPQVELPGDLAAQIDPPELFG